ncbi:hypothetical protein TELCIR_15022 [Teladorsagia circumcincta]|uniref:Uncharacterized protein n=1 Tax=Teladorsagia circumcincta TaxID=45464 RepID=A0A2G9TZN2_TELCI|nr:hypothetical protein TELCIR_15022 [Teladorsagia circumcincta]
MPKPEWSMDKETEKANVEQSTSEDSVSAVFSKQEPTLGAKIANVAKGAATTVWEKKKETCVLLPHNTPCLSNKCMLSKLPGLRQLKDKFQPEKKPEA